MTGPAAEVRRAGAWRWTVTVTGVRSHARPATVTGPRWWARRRAAAILARAAGDARPPDFTVTLDPPPGQLKPRGPGWDRQPARPRPAADVLAGYAARAWAPPFTVCEPPPPVNLYRPAASTVRVLGPDGELAWEGPVTAEPGGGWSAQFTPGEAGPYRVIPPGGLIDD